MRDLLAFLWFSYGCPMESDLSLENDRFPQTRAIFSLEKPVLCRRERVEERTGGREKQKTPEVFLFPPPWLQLQKLTVPAFQAGIRWLPGGIGKKGGKENKKNP